MNLVADTRANRIIFLCINIFFVFVLALIDWKTGYEVQFFVFYFIPIFITAWFCGNSPSIMISTLSAIGWFAADIESGHEYLNFALLYWNTLIRLISFLIVGVAISKIKSLLDKERKITSELQKTISEVKTLRGLIPICCSCKKIRNDKGYWQQMESYISTHTDALFSHGYCSECAKKAFKESGIELGDGEIAEIENESLSKLKMASPATNKNSEDRRQ